MWDQRQIYTSDLGGQWLTKMALWFGCHQTDLLTNVEDHAHPGVDQVRSVLAKQSERVRVEMLPSCCRVGRWPLRPGPGGGFPQGGASRGYRAERAVHSSRARPCFIFKRWVPSAVGSSKSQRRKMGASATAPALTGCLHVRCSQPAPKR